MSDQRHLHRLFGMAWKDFFHGQPVTVEVEKDLSYKQQFLDVVVIRLGDLPDGFLLPDGFDGMAAHNLITFKSEHEAMSAWSLQELIGHYVNYRKQTSPDLDDLIPEAGLRLFAVAARFPSLLAGETTLVPISAGVYDVPYLGRVIRLIVVNQLPEAARNALLYLFSAKDEQKQFAAQTYNPRSREGSTFLLQLFEGYRKEGLNMPYTVEDCKRDAFRLLIEGGALKDLPVEQLLESVPVERRLEGIPTEKRLEGVSVEDRLMGLSPEQRNVLLRLLQAQQAANEPKP